MQKKIEFIIILFYNGMTTLHLLYKSLECILNDKKGIIYILKRQKQIKNVLNECCLLPSVIDNIVYQYTDETIELDCNIKMYGNKMSNNNLFNVNVTLTFEYDNHNIEIWIMNAHGKFVCDMFINYTNLSVMNFQCDIEENDDADNIDTDYVLVFNTFMKYYYMYNNYIDCCTECADDYSIQKNKIMLTLDKYTQTVLKIFNYRKLTYLIVICKCLINGIQKYFKIHDIVKYCGKK